MFGGMTPAGGPEAVEFITVLELFMLDIVLELGTMLPKLPAIWLPG